MRIKKKAALLSLAMGAFGVHKFYLGEKFKGILYLFFGVTAFTNFMEFGSGFIFFMMFIGLIDSILLTAKTQNSFDREYNGGKSSAEEARRSSRRGRRETRRDTRRPSTRNTRRQAPAAPKVSAQRSKAKALIAEGVGLFKSYDYADAIDKFNEALAIDPKNPNVHFNLACAYSLVEETDKAYGHLDKAVMLGFDKIDKIDTHDALAFIRAKDRFATFKSNGYRLQKQIKPPTSVLEDKPQEMDTTNLLQQLQELAQKRRQGELTQDEFLEKKRLLIRR